MLATAGCRSGLDLATAQTAHVVRIEASRFGVAYGQRAIEAENGDYDRAVDDTFAALTTQPTPENIAKVAVLVKKSARARDAQINVIRTDMARFDGYLDMLKTIEIGSIDLYNRQGSLKGLFTGQAAVPAEMPDTTLGGGK